MFEELVGIVDGFTLLADKCVKTPWYPLGIGVSSTFPCVPRLRHVIPHGGSRQYRYCRVVGGGVRVLFLCWSWLDGGYGAWAALNG